MDLESGICSDLGIQPTREKRDRSPVRIIQRNKFEQVPVGLTVVGAGCFASASIASSLSRRRKSKKEKKIIESDAFGNEIIVVDPEAARKRENQRRKELEELGKLKYVTAVKKIKYYYTHPMSGDQIECEMFFNECCAMGLQTSCACNSKTEEGMPLYSYCIQFYCGSFYWVSLNGDFMPRENAARELAFALASVKLIQEVGFELKFRLVAKYGPSLCAIAADAGDSDEFGEDSFSDFENGNWEDLWEDSLAISALNKGPNHTQEKEVASVDVTPGPEVLRKSANFDKDLAPAAYGGICADVSPNLIVTDVGSNPRMGHHKIQSLMSLVLSPPPPPPPPRHSTSQEPILVADRTHCRYLAKDEICKVSQQEESSKSDQKINLCDDEYSGGNSVTNTSQSEHETIPVTSFISNSRVNARHGNIYENVPLSDTSCRSSNVDPDHLRGTIEEVISPGIPVVEKKLPSLTPSMVDTLNRSLVNYSDDDEEDDDDDSTNEKSSDEVHLDCSPQATLDNSYRGHACAPSIQIPFPGLMSFSTAQPIINNNAERPAPKVILRNPAQQFSSQQLCQSTGTTPSHDRYLEGLDSPVSTRTAFDQDRIPVPSTALSRSSNYNSISSSRIKTQSRPVDYWPPSTQQTNHSAGSSSHLLKGKSANIMELETKMTFKQFLESRNIKW